MKSVDLKCTPLEQRVLFATDEVCAHPSTPYEFFFCSETTNFVLEQVEALAISFSISYFVLNFYQNAMRAHSEEQILRDHSFGLQSIFALTWASEQLGMELIECSGHLGAYRMFWASRSLSYRHEPCTYSLWSPG